MISISARYLSNRVEGQSGKSAATYSLSRPLPTPNKELLKAECSIISKAAAAAGVSRIELKKPPPTDPQSGKA